MNQPRLCMLLPYPPSVNHYYKHTRQGTFLTKEARAYRQAVQAAIIDQFGKPGAPDPRLYDIEIMMEVTLYPPMLSRRRDADNSIKALWDALQIAGVIEDDTRIKPHAVFPGEPVPGGCCIVVITPGPCKRRKAPNFPAWWRARKT